MDLTVLSKKISSYRTNSGKITNLPNELLAEILHAWEQWSGPAQGFYKALGVDYRKFGSIMGKAKQLKRDGAFDGLNFTEVVLDQENGQIMELPPCSGVELVWEGGRIIRFSRVEMLLYPSHLSFQVPMT
jgi:hypothetical protein